VDLQKAKMMMRDLTDYYLGKNWTIELSNRSQKKHGLCTVWRNGDPGTVTIYKLSTECRTEDEVLNTIVHEIAHGLAPFNSGHNWEWRRIAKSIGCDGQRCSGGEIKLKKGWKFTCSVCGKNFYRVQKPHGNRYYSHCGVRNDYIQIGTEKTFAIAADKPEEKYWMSPWGHSNRFVTGYIDMNIIEYIEVVPVKELSKKISDQWNTYHPGKEITAKRVEQHLLHLNKDHGLNLVK